MIGVDVRVSQGVDKVSRFEAADVREHAGEQRVGGDVEGDAEAWRRSFFLFEKREREYRERRRK